MGKTKKKHSKYPAIVGGQVLDSSMDSMEETRFRKRNQKLTISLSEKLHFTYSEVECLLLIFYKLQKESKEFKLGVDKTLFRDVLHCSLKMTEDYLMDRIFYTLDKGPSPYMTMETWAASLSLFLKGTLEEKMQYCYKVYDALGEKLLGRETMFHLLRKSLLSLSGEEDAEESAKEMIEVLTKKMDIDRDGKISFNDYRQTILKQPMLLEVFGQCLPTRENIHAFMTTFAQKPGKM
ncbi:EF-hand calcium-binding domain-containing protein 1-like [Anoplophora glabripennis]|uniref:EF-hand calcium-binding domain-containing protein 1-like n=1 Tax=Anoplophora glabripennis TaxID=217634 RepID=UPI000C77DB26|nr:EF-hand calcium-binding domain-containing protein 1-like [Anoplophora glabripennis]